AGASPAAAGASTSRISMGRRGRSRPKAWGPRRRGGGPPTASSSSRSPRPARPAPPPRERARRRPRRGARRGRRGAACARKGRVYVFSETSVPCRVWRLDPASGRRELVREIVPAAMAPLGVRQLFLTEDASSYVYSFNATVSDLYLAESGARR